MTKFGILETETQKMEPETSLKDNFMLILFVLVNLVVRVVSVDHCNRHDFPVDFVFGSGTSAYQVIFLTLMPKPFTFVN